MRKPVQGSRGRPLPPPLAAVLTISELANLITAQAVTKLHELGFRFDLTPPAIFTGDNMEVSNQDVEALIVPMEAPQGKVEINVAIRERA